MSGYGERDRMGRDGRGWAIPDLLGAVDEFRARFERRAPETPDRRTDLRAAVLLLLDERPMHGTQLIAAVEERSAGSWSPDPGALYPLLQLLTDEGLLLVEDADGRRQYSLTEEGVRLAQAHTADEAPWEQAADESPRRAALPTAGFELARAVAEVGRTGGPEQVQEAVRVLDDARRALYGLLARD